MPYLVSPPIYHGLMDDPGEDLLQQFKFREQRDRLIGQLDAAIERERLDPEATGTGYDRLKAKFEDSKYYNAFALISRHGKDPEVFNVIKSRIDTVAERNPASALDWVDALMHRSRVPLELREKFHTMYAETIIGCVERTSAGASALRRVLSYDSVPDALKMKGYELAWERYKDAPPEHKKDRDFPRVFLKSEPTAEQAEIMARIDREMADEWFAQRAINNRPFSAATSVQRDIDVLTPGMLASPLYGSRLKTLLLAGLQELEAGRPALATDAYDRLTRRLWGLENTAEIRELSGIARDGFSRMLTAWTAQDPRAVFAYCSDKYINRATFDDAAYLDSISTAMTASYAKMKGAGAAPELAA